MGQRTAILTKRTFKDGTTNIRLTHVQWGFSNRMHQHFIQQFLFAITDLTKFRFNGIWNMKNYFTFDHLVQNEEYELYANETYTTNPPYIFNKKVIQEYYSKTDNNNGGLIIDVKEKNVTYGPAFEHLKIAFITGPEECKNDQDKPFLELMTGAEYIKRTDPRLDPSFTAMWKNFVEFYGIEEVTD